MSTHTTAIISTWKEYCAGSLSEEEHQSVNFTSLINRSFDEEDFKNIFDYFPQTNDLTSRCLNLSYSKRKLSKSTLSDEDVLSHVAKDIKKLRKICIAANNQTIAQMLDTSDIEIVNISEPEYNKLLSDKIFSQFIDTINDYIIFNHLKQFPGYLDIESSLYHFSGNDFRLTWYLCEPLLQVKDVFDGYYRLWSSHIDYIVTENGIKIIRTDSFI